MTGRPLPLSLDALREAFARERLYNFTLHLDAETGEAVDVADDLVAYCRGEREGTDLQLSDSHELPRAQQIADETVWAERGTDDDGVPFGPDDRRFFPLPVPGEDGWPPDPDATIRRWLDENSFSIPEQPG